MAVREYFRLRLSTKKNRDQAIAAWMDRQHADGVNLSELIKTAIVNEYLKPRKAAPAAPPTPEAPTHCERCHRMPVSNGDRFCLTCLTMIDHEKRQAQD